MAKIKFQIKNTKIFQTKWDCLLSTKKEILILITLFFGPECFALAGPSCCYSAKVTAGTWRVARRLAALRIPRVAAQGNLEARSAWLVQKKRLCRSQRHPHPHPAARSAWTGCRRLALWCQWTATEWALGKQTHSSPSIRSHAPLGDSRLAAPESLHVSWTE